MSQLAHAADHAIKPHSRTGRVALRSLVIGLTAFLTVVDEGPGLTGEEAEQAFGRFWRGNDGAGGSGLGLAIVRATAERHGGRAYAEGSRFTIELPALRDNSESSGRTTRNGQAEQVVGEARKGAS